jgi:hypothetical protein
MYAISTINHVPIILLASASNNVPSMYQSCINYRSSYESSMMYNINTSSIHQIYVSICSSTTCQMHAPRHPKNMPLTIHHNIYQWISHMYQPCTMIDLPQKPFTTTSNCISIHVPKVCLNRSMISLASITSPWYIS